MRDAHLAARVLEAQHQDRFLGRQPQRARDERGIAVELDARGVDRGLAVRRGDHRAIVARRRAADRPLRRGDRGATVRRMDLADRELARPELEHVDIAQRQAAGLRVRLDRRAAADHHRVAERAHLRVERRLQRHLRPDAAGIADRDRYFCLLFNREFKRG